MKFTRRRQRGQSQKTQRMWKSDEDYRIIWRKEAYGVEVLTHYQACVRTLLPNYSGQEGRRQEIWDFVNHNHRSYRSLTATQADCQRHYERWSKACDASGVRALLDLFDILPIGIPHWALSHMNGKALGILTAKRGYRQKAETLCD